MKYSCGRSLVDSVGKARIQLPSGFPSVLEMGILFFAYGLL